ncbi:PilN domain-containing protein [Saccharospirillum salsuginis]|uniref:Pilus assembly protein PilN n=1 Tax=Saccharospirillum salsuginis TaxID=418750 RepID=A0A918K290_9GAMM|nr:PilN domain-containing protein [Saccharospirillum salsuginis]GGX44487.1 pilus assembly protein PilN [Saccharospirillum salsuginis]
MANIDLRPWREERRKERQQQFLLVLVLVVVAAGAAGWSWNQTVKAQIQQQEQRNTFLQQRISDLDKKIEEIRTLREQREKLVERMEVIQSLQGDRPIIVHVFEELVEATPEEVYFTSLSSQGTTINISGRADRPLSISDFLRNLDTSPWFQNAFLINVQSIKEGQEVVGNTFSLRVQRANPNSEADE